MSRVTSKRSAKTDAEARQYIEDLYQDNLERYVNDERGPGDVGELQHIFQKWHYVAELLQNALDEGARRIRLAAEEDRLTFEHNGNPFDARNVYGLCNKGLSAKGAGTVGFMGLGFKSVFHRYERAYVSSNVWRFLLEVPLQREERYNDPHLDWTGCFLPRWSADLEAPVDGMNCRFVFTGRRGGTIADDLTQVLGPDSALLALLAWRGVEELYWTDQHWTLTADETLLDQEDRRLILTAKDQNGGKQSWVLFERRYQPSDFAISAFLTHRRIRPKPADREKVYREAARRREVALFCPLKDGRLQPVEKRGLIYALLPTNVTTPLGMHLQADWLLNTSREELIHRENNAWHEAIRDQIPALLRRVLEWTAELGRQGVSGWEYGYKALPEASSTANRDDAWLAGLEFEALLTAQLRSLPVFPLPPNTEKPAEFTSADQTRFLPAPLANLVGEDPVQQRQLFGSRAISSGLLGDRALACLRRLKLLTELEPVELEEHWQDGTAVAVWYKAVPKKEREATLAGLLEALAELDDDDDWLMAELVCLPTEGGGWTSRKGLIRFPKNWDTLRADERVHQALLPSAGALERLLQWRFDAYLTRNQTGLGYIQNTRPQDMKTITDRWWNTLPEQPSEEEAELVMYFTNWVRKKMPKVSAVVRKVLARYPKKRKQLLESGEVLLADPYASVHRRVLFEDVPAVIREYLDVDGEADATAWRTFFNSPAVPNGLQGDLILPTLNDLKEHKLRERVGGDQELPYLERRKRLWWMRWHPQCYRFWDSVINTDLWKRLSARDVPRQLLVAFANALNDETRDYLGRRARPRIQYYVDWKQKDHEVRILTCPSTWLNQLAELRWVFSDDKGPYFPHQVLPPGSLAEEGSLVATLPVGLAEKLPTLAFRKPLADASAAERLRILGPTTDDPTRLATLLDEARADGSREEGDRQELLEVLAQTELFPARDGTRRPYSRLIGPKQTAVARATDLAGFLLWVNDLSEPVASAVERLHDFDEALRIPEVAVTSQIIAFLRDIWQNAQRSPDRPPEDAGVRDVMAQAYRYLAEDLEAAETEEGNDLQQEWEDIRQEAWVFADDRWVPAETAILDDLDEPALRIRMSDACWATGRYLGRSLDDQKRIAWWLGLFLLSDQVTQSAVVGSAVENDDVVGWRERFARLVIALQRLQEREQPHTGPSGEPRPPLDLRVVSSLTLQTTWVDGSTERVITPVPAHVIEARPPEQSGLYVTGQPADFSLAAFDLLLGRFPGLRGGTSFAGRLSLLLALLDSASRFERILAEVCAEYGVELPAPMKLPVSAPEPEEDEDTPDETEGDTNGDDEGEPTEPGPGGNGRKGRRAGGSRRPGGGGSGGTTGSGGSGTGGGQPTQRPSAGGSTPGSGWVPWVFVNPEGSDGSAREKRDDDRGRAAVLAYEEQHNRQAEEKEKLQEGYDVASFDPSTKITRRIEVKGIQDWLALPVCLTEAQFRHGFGDPPPNIEYWLYVVDGANSTRPRIFAIRAAAQRVKRFFFDGRTWRELADEQGEVDLPLPPLTDENPVPSEDDAPAGLEDFE